MELAFAVVFAGIVTNCAIAKAPKAQEQNKAPDSCFTVVSPFVEDPIVIPPSLSDNIELCAPKHDLYRVTKECVSLAAVRRYIFTHAAQSAELER